MQLLGVQLLLEMRHTHGHSIGHCLELLLHHCLSLLLLHNLLLLSHGGHGAGIVN